ncbi:chlororespiratory reduction protein 7 [Cyanobium sp. PCC 7001]|uniref:chlororespiratory reduction protein 7 n=1 Tax=Cyanobium sp. PCC 7001 TaxID=180281 RepID=UPI0005B9699B|nr:chlororespiratory reduction protein 7 [Cyanobium sp. PCC 7001]
MSDPLIRELDHYVVLEPAGSQEILTAADTVLWLERQLARLTTIPDDLAVLPGGRERAERLLETACELELEPGVVIQWFAVRLDPPGGG